MRICPKCQAPVPEEAPQGLCPKCLLAVVSAPTEAGVRAEAPSIPSLESVAAAFPQLKIVEFIGKGGMGLVYKARQPHLDRLVALKLLPQKPDSDPTFGERFTREARVLARLNHPNIVAVYDFGRVEGFFFLAMEFVDGVNLRQAMRAGRFTPAQALALVPRICDALQYAHDEGVLHRDIKPENLLLDVRGRVKIADFGIAKLLGDNQDLTLTASGAAIGTPHYMAPEQFEHPHEVDQRADIFSLGVVFYEMLTGELPLGRFAPPSEKADVDARIDQIVMRTLEKERERRFQSAGEVKTRVENVTANPLPAEPSRGGQHNPQNPAGPGTPGGPPPPSISGGGTSGERPGRPSRRAFAGLVLAGLSLMCLLLVLLILSAGHAHGGGIVVLLLLFALPATAGTWLGWSALHKYKVAPVDSKHLWFARISALLWPLFLCDIAMFLILILSVRNLELHLFHMNAPVLTVFAGFVALAGIAALNWSLGRDWVKRWRSDPLAVPFEGLMAGASRTRRVAVGATGLMVVFILSTLLVHLRRSAEPPQETILAQPTSPPGYGVPMGLPPGNDWTYQSRLSVPAGYVLTLTATLWSNQIPVKVGAPSSAFIISPPLHGTHGHVAWRLLGNQALADGAPLEFSVGLDQHPELEARAFDVVTPQPVAVDWVGQPAQVWPPWDGQTKFVLVKGTGPETSGPAQLDSDPVKPSGANPDADPSSPPEPNRAAEWVVGLETRLDPIPPELLRRVHRPQFGSGTNWVSLIDPNPTSEADALKLESQSSNP